MCKIPYINIGIRYLDFTRRGKMIICLTDGRELSVPLAMYPDIKKLSVKQRNDWMVLDDQFFTFNDLSKVYSVADIFSLGQQTHP